MAQERSVSSEFYGGLHIVVRLLIWTLVAIGVLLVARIVLIFFGTLSTLPGYDFIVSTSEALLGPFSQIESVTTPYDGIFDIGATILLLIVIAAEFMVGSFGSYLRRKSREASLAAQRAAAQIEALEDEFDEDEAELEETTS